MNIIVTLDAGMGTSLGPNFLIYSDVGTVTYEATLAELLIGIERTFEDTATIILIESLGDCINVLSLIIDLSCTTTTSTTSEPTTTTTSTLPVSTTTTTTTACIEVNYSVDIIEAATTSTTSSTTTTTSTSSTTTTTTTIQAITDVKYGYLYNYYAVADAREITSLGWSVATYIELGVLKSYCTNNSYSGTEGTALKSDSILWDSGAGDDAFGFNAEPSGYRWTDGSFYSLTLASFIWSATQTNSTNAWSWGLVYNNALFADTVYGKKLGGCVYLIKDITTLSHGETGTYTGNDGKVYPTICIGAQEYIACNLAETKYRNGDWITGYDGGTYTAISNANWAAKTTEAMCAYDDDESNAITI